MFFYPDMCYAVLCNRQVADTNAEPRTVKQNRANPSPLKPPHPSLVENTCRDNKQGDAESKYSLNKERMETGGITADNNQGRQDKGSKIKYGAHRTKTKKIKQEVTKHRLVDRRDAQKTKHSWY